MVTLNSDSRPIIGRGPPLGAKFFFLAVLSITAMVFDHRGPQLETVRRWIGVGLHPLYAVVQTPFGIWDWLTGSFADRTTLRTENATLKEQLRVARLQMLRFDSLQEENARLRAIRKASEGMGERTLIAEIVDVDIDDFRQRVIINQGTGAGVFKGQAVIDAHGIVGQVLRAGRYSSEVILITDAEHAVPVQLNRNGIRTIAEGATDTSKLTLRFLTADADVKVGDLLVSSGLGGVFPQGYPVAHISKITQNPAEAFAAVEAKPLAELDRSREVLLLWFKEPALREAPAAAIPSTMSPPTAAKPAVAPPKPAATTAPAATPTATPTPATTPPARP